MKDVFYQSESKNFTNALEFWKHINTTDENFSFHLYENQFKSVDWTKEPIDSVEILCSMRAKQIRDKYDYVRIWYSAGRDSHHILKTFLENNLRVDELLIMDWSILKRFETDASIAYKSAVDTFTSYGIPLPKITIFKTEKEQYNRFFCKDFYLKYGAYSTNYNFNLNHYPNIIQAFPELTDGRGKLCEVYGFEKSKIHMDDDGKFYFQMNDKNFNQGLGHADNSEWFYLSGDLPELAIKQSHIIMNFLTSTFGKTLLKHQVREFQEGRSSYDLFASVLKRGPKISHQTGGGVNKTFGFNHNQYSEIFYAAKIGNWPALKHYNEYLNYTTILNQGYSQKYWEFDSNSFAGVITPKYYLT